MYKAIAVAVIALVIIVSIVTHLGGKASVAEAASVSNSVSQISVTGFTNSNK